MRSFYFIFLIFLIVSNTAMATEETKFKLIEHEGEFEIREYRYNPPWTLPFLDAMKSWLN
jgi:hypothetical protein